MRTKLNADFDFATQIPTPPWAKEMAKQFCNDKNLPIPSLYWFRGPKQNACTNKCTKEIALIEGGEIPDQCVLLHELTHYQVETDASTLDGVEFWSYVARWQKTGGHDAWFFLNLKENIVHYMPHLYNIVRFFEIGNNGSVAERVFGA